MKYPTRLSDAVHILAFIALYPDCDLTSNKLAESIQTNPAYVRQLMSALRKGGLLVSVKGHPRPALAREPEKITLKLSCEYLIIKRKNECKCYNVGCMSVIYYSVPSICKNLLNFMVHKV